MKISKYQEYQKYQQKSEDVIARNNIKDNIRTKLSALQKRPQYNGL